MFEPLEGRTLMSGAPATFSDLGNLTGRQTVGDTVSTSQAVDSYKFQLPAAGSINLLLSGLTHNANLHLLNSSGGQISTSAAAGTANDQINVNSLSAGTYFAQVDFVNDGSAGTSTAYALQLTADKAGNTLATARDLGDLSVATTKTINDFVDASDTADFYKFELSSIRQVNVLMNNLTANADLQVIVDVVNPGVVDTGEVVLSSSNTGTNFDQVTPTFGPGTYFLKVQPAGNAATNYTLNINSLPGAVADDHGGDSASNPRAIGTLGFGTQTFVDFVGSSDGADVYQFNLAHLSRINAHLDGLTDNADLQLFTAPAPSFFPETLISSSVNTNALPDDISQTVAAGTYFLRVQHVSGDTFYRLQMGVTEEDGAGDTLAAARNLGTLSNVTFNERVGGPDADDFYKFTVSAFKHVSINVNGLSTADVSLQLLDHDGQLITVSDHPGEANESIVQNLVPGTYFAQVSPKIGEGPYHLAFNVTNGPDGAGNTLASAHDLGSLLHGASKTLSDYVGPDDTADMFKFTLPNGSHVRSSFVTSVPGVNTFFVQDRNHDGQIQSSEKLFNAADLVPGTFFFRVEKGNTTGAKYSVKLTVSDIDDGGGNTFASAGTLGNIHGNGTDATVGGYVGFDDTIDIFRFDVNPFGTVTITLDHLQANADV
ncbi:MAG TPA: PPC domain-containing protein, partial [Tepidisphaeraceae bacterium]|nr:PPC domain-containing protein [Tepidisphaeraceae bacterium]